jgi:hypothetical protein
MSKFTFHDEKRDEILAKVSTLSICCRKYDRSTIGATSSGDIIATRGVPTLVLHEAHEA